MGDAELAVSSQPITVQTLKTLIDTPQVPNRYKTVGEMVATVLTGREVGLMEMTSLREMHIINGQVGMSAKMQHALVHKAGHVMVVEEMTNTRASINAFRRDPYTHELMPVGAFQYTMEDAELAGNAGTDTYTSYPADMLMSRCITRTAKFAFSDVMAGFYLPEEIGGESVHEEGITDLDAAAVLVEETLDATVVDEMDAAEAAESEGE